MYDYNAVITRVIDGDTVVARIDLGFDVAITRTLRFARIDAPERRTESGIVSTEFVKQFEGEKIKVITKKPDKYGRTVAELFVDYDSAETNLNDLLMEKGLAIAWP